MYEEMTGLLKHATGAALTLLIISVVIVSIAAESRGCECRKGAHHGGAFRSELRCRR